MKDISEEDCRRIQQWMNHYSTKMLGYETPIASLNDVSIKKDKLEHR